MKNIKINNKKTQALTGGPCSPSIPSLPGGP